MNLITSLAILSSALISLNATLVNDPSVINIPIVYMAPSKVDNWINSLKMCESGGNDKALNPKDLDGTASKGRFQFKDKTFYSFAKKYNIHVTSVWNGDEQELILKEMIDDKDVNLHQQFPACVKKLGLPPQESV